MALTTGIYGNFLLVQGTGASNFQLNGTDTIKLDLVDGDTETPDFDADNDITDVTGIVTGTNWASAYTLSTPTFTLDTGNTRVEMDAVDVSQANTTISTSFEGCVIWDDSITTPTADLLLCCLNFGSSYTTSTGTLTITFGADGFMQISY